MEKLNTAVIGTGFGAMHIGNLSSMDQVDLTHIGGRNEQRVKELAEQFDCTGTTDFGQIIMDPEIDLVLICLPTDLHTEWVCKALENGKHVFCETPIAYKEEDVARIRLAEARSGKTVSVGMFGLFTPLRSLIQDTLSADTPWRSLLISRKTAPVWGSMTNMVVDLMLHDFDLTVCLFGLPRSVRACGLLETDGCYRHVYVYLEYTSGQVVVEGCALMPSSFPFTVTAQFLGDDSAIDYRFAMNKEQVLEEIRVYPEEGPSFCPEIEGGDPYVAEMQYLTETLLKGERPALLSLQTAAASLKVALAAKESLETGETIQMPGVPV